MKIRFLFGYMGRETAMKAYNEGEVIEINHDAALTLIDHGIAEEVTEFARCASQKVEQKSEAL
jgi:hypothetical protein